MSVDEIKKKLDGGDIFGLQTAASTMLSNASDINMAAQNFASIANKHQRLMNTYSSSVFVKFSNGDEYSVKGTYLFEKIKQAVLEQMTADMKEVRITLDMNLKKALE